LREREVHLGVERLCTSSKTLLILSKAARQLPYCFPCTVALKFSAAPLAARMKTSDNLAQLRTLFAAERDATFADFTDVYCVANEDDVLARFVGARRGDPDAALAFLKEDYAWRRREDAAALRSMPAADVLERDPAILAEYYRRRCVGLDNQGRLTFYQAYASCVVKKLKTVVPLETVVKYHLWEQERACAMLDHLKSNGRGDGTMAIILDVQGMTIGKHINKDFIWLVKAIAAKDQAHYPERMGVTYIVNAPGVFGLVWRTIRPFLDAATRDKIRIVTARRDWHAEVRLALGDAVVDRVQSGGDVDGEFSRAPAAVAASLGPAVIGRDSHDSFERSVSVESFAEPGAPDAPVLAEEEEPVIETRAAKKKRLRLRKKAARLRAAAARAAAGSPSPRAATGSPSLHRTRAALDLEAPARQERSRSSAEIEALWPALRHARSLDAQRRGSVSPASSNGLKAEPLWTATEEEAPLPPTRPSESPLQERLKRPARPSGTPPSSVATRSSSSCTIFCGPGWV